MKKLLLLSIIILLCSCRGALISDDIIIVHSKHQTPRNFYYKYYYKCYQNGHKMRVYSNDNYEVGQPLLLK